MINGQMPESAANWLNGLIALAAVVGILLTVYLQVKSIRKGQQEERAKFLAEAEADKCRAVAEAKKETESAYEFRQLKKAVEEVSQNVSTLTTGVNSRIDALVTEVKVTNGKLRELERDGQYTRRLVEEHIADTGEALAGTAEKEAP